MKFFLQGFDGRMGKIIRQLALAKGFKAYPLSQSKKKSGSLLVDFSSSSGLSTALDFALSRALPLLSGTTALEEEVREKLHQAAKQIPIVYSTNFSIGILFLRQILRQFSPKFPPNFSPTIIEQHHSQKKDAPSGTAKTLQLELQNPASVPIFSIRIGELAGTHQVVFSGPNETFTFTHEATSRDIFARGALLCSEKMLAKKLQPGLYTVEDILQL